MAEVLLQGADQFGACLLIGFQIEPFYLLADDPIGHRIDVVADYIAAETVGLKQRSSPSHEWVCHSNSLEVVGLEETLAD